MRRNETVDLIRIVAAFGVIAIHVASGTPSANTVKAFFLPLCVPFFYVISLTYFIISLRQVAVAKTFSRIWWRVVIPYLVWTAVYVGLMAGKKILQGTPPDFEYWKVVFYGGSALQLYFLPQLIMMQVLLVSFRLLTPFSIQRLLLSLGLLAAVICYLLIGYHYNCFGVTPPAIIIALILGAYWLASIIKKNKTFDLYLVIGVALVVGAEFREFLHLSFPLVPAFSRVPIGGIGLALIAINLPINKMPRFLSTLCATSFGVYLCHVLFLESFEFVVPKIWKGGLVYDFVTKLGVVSLILILSVLFTLLLNRFTITKQLFLGKRV